MIPQPLTRQPPSRITTFSGEHAFLSNFYPSPFYVLMDETWPKVWLTEFPVFFRTVEHWFQACKADTRDGFHAIVRAETPGQAKRIGRSIDLRPDWEDIKVDVMGVGLRLKFDRGTDLASRLLATGDAALVEGNTWGDRVWGAVLVDRTTPWDDYPVSCWDGENLLGRLLMERRDQLRSDVDDSS